MTDTRVDRVVGLARALRGVRGLPAGFTGLSAGGREVRVERAHGLAVDWIVLRTPICTAGEIDLEQVLERHARLAFATIALAHGVYWLRLAVPADSAELADPARLIALLIDAAGSLAPRRAIQAGPSAAFDHFAG